MKLSFLVVFASALIFAFPANGATSADALERQLREDLGALIRAKNQRPSQDDEVSKAIDSLAAQLKSSFPGILAVDSTTTAPTEDALRRAYSDLKRAGAGAPMPVLVSFYTELWRSKPLKPDQAIIFVRVMSAITLAVEKQRNEKKGLTSRQSQRRCLSRSVLAHSSRQPAPWLICNDRRKKDEESRKDCLDCLCASRIASVPVGRIGTRRAYSGHSHRYRILAALITVVDSSRSVVPWADSAFGIDVVADGHPEWLAALSLLLPVCPKESADPVASANARERAVIRMSLLRSVSPVIQKGSLSARPRAAHL
jgi:hypothetical protein